MQEETRGPRVFDSQSEVGDDYIRRIKKHRFKIFLGYLITLLILVVIILVTILYFERKSYTSFEVLDSIERHDTMAAGFTNFNGNLLKYTNDGAMYTSLDGTLIWNQTYEMDNPDMDMSRNYVALYDKGGSEIYILNNQNLCGSIHITQPILRVSVADQGTVAVLAEYDGTSYLSLYDKSGEQLAAGELHVKNAGFPLDIEISSNGEKLAVSMLDINSSTIKTTLAFYNFGNVGQNEIDKIVGSFSFNDLLIPDVEYLSDDTMLAFANDKVIVYKGTQKPEEFCRVNAEAEIKSIFYDDKYFGFVYNSYDTPVTDNDDDNLDEDYCFVVYNMSGNEVTRGYFSTEYDQIEFLDNHQICIRNREEIELYSLHGIKKLSYKSEDKIYKVFSGKSGLVYTIIFEGETRKVRLT